MPGHLTTDEFFTQLSSLIDTTQKKGHGSVYLTQKRLTFDLSSPASNTNPSTKVADDPLWDLHPPNPLPLIIRATDGKSHVLGKDGPKDRSRNKEKVKISTVVQPDDIEAFFASYAEVCKSGMHSLKKRDRSKRKKAKKGKGAVNGEKKV